MYPKLSSDSRMMRKSDEASQRRPFEQEEIDAWIRALWSEAETLRQPLPDHQLGDVTSAYSRASYENAY